MKSIKEEQDEHKDMSNNKKPELDIEKVSDLAFPSMNNSKKKKNENNDRMKSNSPKKK